MYGHYGKSNLRGFDELTCNLAQRLSALYKESLECANLENSNTEQKLRKCFEDNMAMIKGITTDNDSGYMSQNIESNSSADTSLDHRNIPLNVPENHVKQVFLSEDALLEKPTLYPKDCQREGGEFSEYSHLYFISNIPDNPIINSSVASQSTTFSGFEEESISDYSGSIPIATPITVNASTLETLSEFSKKNVSEKENDMNIANIKENSEQEKKLNIEENELSSIQSRMMDANNCDMSLFESFYSFVCKLYTKNETVSEEIVPNSINPSQLHVGQATKQPKTSPYKSSYLQLECSSSQASTSNTISIATSTPTPTKKVQTYTATSPELFSDEDTVENSTQNKSQCQNSSEDLYTLDNDYILLKKVRDSLTGLPPPPSMTISLLTATEMLQKAKDNFHLFTTKDDVINNKKVSDVESENKKSLLVNCNECDITSTQSFSDVMNLRYHGLHHNRSKVNEEFEHLCVKYTERCIGAETQSTCTTFGVNSLSPSKRKGKCRKPVKSPGKRLSHLARRRITFSKDSLQSSMNNTNCSFIGSRTRQIMVDARKYELISRRRSPKKKSPRKTPVKSPRKKGNTPSKGSGKKKFASQFNPQAIEESLDALSQLSSSSSKPSTTKRALFQSPPNKDSKCSTIFSLFNSDSNSSCSQHSTSRSSRRSLFTSPKRNSPSKMTISSLYPARRKMTPKRVLFKSPDKQSPSKFNEVCDKKRKRTDEDDGNANKISKNVSSEISDLDSSNEVKSDNVHRPSSSSSTQDITQHRKKKLMWTVAEALRSQNIDLKHPQFKVYASVLARIIRHFLPNLFTNGPRPEGSTTESMLRIARQYVFAVTRGKTVDQILREAQKNKSRIRRPSGYVGLDKIADCGDILKNKENILQDRINVLGSESSDNKTYNKNRRSEHVERIRRVINFGDNEVISTGIR